MKKIMNNIDKGLKAIVFEKLYSSTIGNKDKQK